MLAKIAERRAQLEQQLLDIHQMQLELDTAQERCVSKHWPPPSTTQTTAERHRKTTMSLPNHVRRSRPRDGLQNEAQPISVSAKVRLVDDLTEAGLAYIEVGVSCRAKWVPPARPKCLPASSSAQALPMRRWHRTCAVLKTHWPQA